MAALDSEALRHRLSEFREVRVVASTGSTNADLVAAAREGAADRTLLFAERQTAGRGRRSRQWASPSDAGLYSSVLLRPAGVPAAALGWLPLLAGVAAVETVREVAGVAAELKWPNDLLAGGGKLAGILAEAVPGGGSAGDGPAVVVGTGLNVSPLPSQPPPGAGGLPAVSLTALGAVVTDRTELAVAFYRRFAEWEARWRARSGDAERCGLLAAYRGYCGTIGRAVTVELPDEPLTGTALDVDTVGRLILRTAQHERRALSAGDVVHLRGQPQR